MGLRTKPEQPQRRDAAADTTLPAGTPGPEGGQRASGPRGGRAAGDFALDVTVVAPDPEDASSRLSGDAGRFQVTANGSYTIQGELAQGGLGRILRAHDARLDRPVALKELLAGGRSAEERFVREALLTARLQHPSIVPIYEAGRWPTGEPFYAMKLVSGRSLAEVIDETRTLDQRFALLPHVLAVAEAIAYAHSEGILHRDLKPANILIGAFGETVVIDWGLAKDVRLEAEAAAGGEGGQAPEPDETRVAREVVADGKVGPAYVSSPGLTMVGAVMGTPAYMPPEQASGSPVDERADVYALGAILYHLLAGSMPYDGDDAIEIVNQVLAGPPEALDVVQRGIPEDLLAIVRKAMARAPAERYRTARELAEDLRRFQTGQIVRAHDYSAWERLQRFVRRYRAPLVVLAGALMVLSGAGALGLGRVLEARRVAEDARDRATRERDRAATAEQRATERADTLTLVEAGAAVTRDPNEAVAWLKTLSPSFERWRAARAVAADARSQGIALVLRGHTAAINTAIFSPDGRTLASASDDRTVRLWDVATGSVRVLSGHTDEVWNVAFSPDGRLMATGGKDHLIRVWDVATGESRILAGHRASVRAMRFSPDGGRLFTRDGDGQIWLWDVARGEGTALPSPSCKDVGLELSPDGSSLAFTAEGRLVIVDVAGASGAARRSFPGQDAPAMDSVLSPDGAQMATGDDQGVIRVWSMATGAVRVLRGHAGGIRALAYLPGGAGLVSSGWDGTVRIWDPAEGTARVLRGHEGAVYTVAVSPDGESILSGAADHTARLWDVATGGSRVLRGFSDGEASVAFSPDGKTAAVASYDQTIRLFRLDAHPDRIVARSEGAMGLAIFSPDGRRVAAAGEDGVVRVAGLEGGRVSVLRGHEGAVRDLCFSPDGTVLVSAGEDGVVRLWTGDAGAPRALLGHEGAVLRLACSPDGARVASAGRDGSVRLWELAGGEGRLLHRHAGAASALGFSRDGQRLASGGQDGVVMTWELKGGRERTLRGHEGEVSVVTFSQNGSLLASGGSDHTIRIWEAASGASRRVIEANGSGVTRLVFLPDGKRFVTLGGEANARLWELATGQLVEVLRGHNGAVLGMALAPSGDRVATAGRDGTVRIWDLEGGVSRVLAGHTGEARWLSFSPGGQALVSASQDGTARLWADDLPVEGAGLRAFFEAATRDKVELDRSGGRAAAPGAQRGSP